MAKRPFPSSERKAGCLERTSGEIARADSATSEQPTRIPDGPRKASPTNAVGASKGQRYTSACIALSFASSQYGRSVALLDAYTGCRFGLSFELFPPKTAESEATMWTTVEELMAFGPSMITCTYGAGGSTRDKTLDIVAEVSSRHRVPVASHLTCVGSTTDDLRDYLRAAMARGVSAIVALRGDPPKGETAFQPVEGGLRYAAELVAMIREEFPSLGILVAGYPETHQEALSPEADLENLKRKCDAGGDVIVTQLFYDNADFFRFRDACDKLGISAPIVPGIMPVTNYGQIKRIATLCKARLPESFTKSFEAAGEDAEAQFEAGVAFATQQVRELLDAEVPGIHFYVLNRSPATSRVLEQVGHPRMPSSN